MYSFLRLTANMLVSERSYFNPGSRGYKNSCVASRISYAADDSLPVTWTKIAKAERVEYAAEVMRLAFRTWGGARVQGFYQLQSR